MKFCFSLKTEIYESEGATVLKVFSLGIISCNII